MKTIDLHAHTTASDGSCTPTQLVELAGGLDSVVTIQKGERAVAATRLMALMTLGVSRGDRVTVTLEGGDEEAALRTVEQFFQEHL